MRNGVILIYSITYLQGKYIAAMGLGGGMVWSIETDDFMPICQGYRFPLLNTLKNAINGPTDQMPINPCNGESSVQSTTMSSIAPTTQSTTQTASTTTRSITTQSTVKPSTTTASTVTTPARTPSSSTTTTRPVTVQYTT